MIIEELAKEYLEASDYHRGFINGEWVERVTSELHLRELSDIELSNMWDMVYLTLDHKFNYYDRNKEYT